MPSLPHRNRSQQCLFFLGLQFVAPTQLRLTYRPTLFNAPQPHNTTYVPSYGGIYAVMVYDSTWKPLPYRPIYIGEAQNLSERVCQIHEKYDSWVRAACGGQLYVAFHCIEGEAARKAAERRLIEHFKPECNKTFNHNALPLRALAGDNNALVLRALMNLYSEHNWPL